jgi:hypothetical protein
VSALLLATFGGGFLGTVNLWRSRVERVGVPVDLNHAHGVLQLFGFMLLMIMGVSFQIAPRFLGGVPANKRLIGFCLGTSLVGILATVAGCFEFWVKGLVWVGVFGSGALWLGVTAWLLFIWRLKRSAAQVQDLLPMFLMAGTLWWWAGASALVAWSAFRVTGPLSSAALLESVFAASMSGGCASWLLGIFLRAGSCTLRIERPSRAKQFAIFSSWQAAAALTFLASVFESSTLHLVAYAAGGLATTIMLVLVAPFQTPAVAVPNEPLIRRVVQAGFGFAVAHAALSFWAALGLAELVPFNGLLRDGVRHSLTLGWALLLVFGFAGRMLPGFEAVSMARPRFYDVGVSAVVVSALCRLFEVFAAPWALIVAGLSGVLALIGIMLVATSFLSTLHTGRMQRRELRRSLDFSGAPVQIRVSLS